MFLTEFFGLFSLSAFVMWGFLMAFFFNVFVYTLEVKRGTTLLLSSFVMMISYTLSDYFLTWLSLKNTLYLDWAIYDVVTLVALSVVCFFIKKTTPSFLYLATGLSINSLFFFSMYLDIYIYGNTEPWIFWDIYTFTINVVDLIMIVALIVDRDFLGLHTLKNKLISLFKTSELNQIQ
ncbi:hypothetical protein CWC14_09160 [Pseudoalteromonas sp. S3260]|uniref:hypothetical protein n=1 Tax=Pseudoalteromonas sp. S3260 TaxID=579534 RepID=UPI00110BBE18|nr:hypothetical protein [Pseudoalteromonas sp. S3260]TMO97175.1 hypothetical protein CWC14_09160 [Pseudoalteromonas sp. S3260]